MANSYAEERQGVCFVVMLLFGIGYIGGIIYLVYCGVELGRNPEDKSVCESGFYDGKKCYWVPCQDIITQEVLSCTCGSTCIDPSELQTYYYFIGAGLLGVPLLFGLFVFCCSSRSRFDPILGGVLCFVCFLFPGACYCTYAESERQKSKMQVAPAPLPALNDGWGAGAAPVQNDFRRDLDDDDAIRIA
eukprot:gb/GEZN01016979.1/.p1 GENE.gb/GEZN01016979.1/~~gb/GEZN01016979.1/.p1  ORF type:complete len:189 (-),score=12.16 gb/GEZN01016979.1/:222-788(-)